MSTMIVGQGGSGTGGGGGGSNASVGATGVTAPTSATEIGIVVSGNLQAVSAANPLPISGSISASNPSVGTNGSAIPTSSTQIGGSDGTDLRAILVDASGHLIITASFFGATGSAVPASASYNGINVAGNLRGQTGVNVTGSVYAAQCDLTSLNGVGLGSPSNFGTTPTAVEVQGVNASLFIGTTVAVAAAAGIQKVGISGNAGVTLDAVLGAATPANALLVGGSDGTDLRAISTDNTGQVKVLVEGGTGVPVTNAGTFATQPAQSGTLTDKSGTITTGNTPQTLAAVNANRKYIFIQNPSSQTESLFINFTTAASTSLNNSIELLPGGSFERTLATYVTTELISVVATTISHPFVAKEG